MELKIREEKAFDSLRDYLPESNLLFFEVFALQNKVSPSFYTKKVYLCISQQI
jgi:hypothetical protein